MVRRATLCLPLGAADLRAFVRSSYSGYAGSQRCIVNLKWDPTVASRESVAESVAVLADEFALLDRYTPLQFDMKESLRRMYAQRAGASKSVAQFKYVALGGTFDRLHNGHITLLATALLHVTAGSVVRIGITTEGMLASKPFANLIASSSHRMTAVASILYEMCGVQATGMDPDSVDPGPDGRGGFGPAAVAAASAAGVPYIYLFPLTNPAGGVDSIAACDALVASPETLPAVAALNAKREARGLPPMAPIAVPFCGGDTEGAKVSSREIRERDAAAAADASGDADDECAASPSGAESDGSPAPVKVVSEDVRLESAFGVLLLRITGDVPVDRSTAADRIEILMIKQAGSGDWAVPKGRPEAVDCSPVLASLRELSEEAGVEVASVAGLLPRAPWFSVYLKGLGATSKLKTTELRAALVKRGCESVPLKFQVEEVSDGRWCSLSSAAALATHKRITDIIFELTTHVEGLLQEGVTADVLYDDLIEL